MQNGYGQDGMVTVVLDDADPQTCGVPISCNGCSLTSTKVVVAEKSQNGRAHVICGNGTGHVETGKIAIPVLCTVTPITQAWRLATHTFERYKHHGVARIGGVWEDLWSRIKFTWSWFPGGWMLPVVLGMASLLFLGRLPTMLICIGVLLVYVKSVSADVGCGIDTTRRTISCGSGAFVWNHLGDGVASDHSVELDDYEFTDRYIKDMFNTTNKPPERRRIFIRWAHVQELGSTRLC